MSLLRDRIAELVARHGSYRAASKVLGVGHVYLWRLGTGAKNDPGEDILKKLKLRRRVTVTYERIR